MLVRIDALFYILYLHENITFEKEHRFCYNNKKGEHMYGKYNISC